MTTWVAYQGQAEQVAYTTTETYDMHESTDLSGMEKENENQERPTRKNTHTRR